MNINFDDAYFPALILGFFIAVSLTPAIYHYLLG